ncbi:MAG: hypothetical protein LBR47_07405 [Spirochaetaceae bacterium]|jgi:hypothetical protein|nr:hypothetical protein [Spirochaetaceae bacterium]
MNIRAEIVDYEQDKDEIEKWLRVKGEDKYFRFLTIVKNEGMTALWKNISDLYRYDKRILINCFRYFSFLEEFLRAVILNNDKRHTYEKLNEERTCFFDILNIISQLPIEILSTYFNTSDIKNKLISVQLLRNKIAHNHIIIQSEYKKYISDFYYVLPSDYHENFKECIIQCANDLNISKKIKITEADFHEKYN